MQPPPRMRRAPLLLLATMLAACAGKGAAPVESPAAGASSTAVHPGSPAASSSAAASSAPVAELMPPDAPPAPAELGRRFRQASPLTHVAAHLVDEGCLVVDRLPPKVQQGSSVGLTDLREDGLHWTSADTNSATATQLAELRAFVASFPRGKHRFVLTTYEWGLGADKRTGFRALCLEPKALFAGPSQMGRIRHKDGSYDEDKYRVGLADTALRKIQALPREAVRLAILFGDDLLVLLPVDKLKELSAPALALAPLPPP